ncbi:aggregation-promoting factor C-terminal-like domain-containing protein [Actinomadura geliboluensis]|uniref:aggregation-promoting factor C-terminal-like domain-containing protein n=1 Tax=Actinomadura geliboluensis TaxID=882440 RepID=UPI0036A72DA0
MAEHDGGSVGIDILPKINASAWGREIKARLDPVVAKEGRALGRTLAAGMKQGFSPLRIEEALRDASPRLEAAAGRLGRRMGAQIARSIKAELELKLRNLPEANVRAKVKIDEASLERARERLSSLGPFTVKINADADTAEARAQLAALQAQIWLLQRSNVNINVSANTGRATRNLMILGAEMAILASIPLGATLAAGIGAIAASATAAAAGIGGILAVAIPGVRRVSEALQAQKTADNQVTRSTQGRTVALNSSAIATEQARLRVMQMAQAERQVTQAQAAARQAQRDLNQARVDGARSLQDLQNNLIDAGLSLRSDELAVERARRELEKLGSTRKDDLAVQKAQTDLAATQARQAKVLGDARSTQLDKDQAALSVALAEEAIRKAKDQRAERELDRREAQLAYEQAVQQLKEQRLLVQRLRADEAKARKAGVEGTQEVVAAKQRLRDALEQVADAQRNVRQQQIQDRIAALQQADAQRQAASAADGATAANVRLGRALAHLTPAEQDLLKGWKAFSKVYREWVNDLEPDVLPVLTDGLGLFAFQLGKLPPMVRSSSAAFRILETRAAVALDGPFWTNFINNVGIAAPQAILRFGGIAGNTLTGVAGIFNAFLPFTNLLLGAVERLTGRFAAWGTSLGGSDGFISFIAYVQQTGPQVVHTIGSLGSAFLDVSRALAPLAAIQLGAITMLANGIAALAREYPNLIQFAAAALLVSKAVKVLGISSLIAGLTGAGAAAGVAGGAMLRLGGLLRTLGAAMMGVSAQAATTRTVLMGLGRAAGVLVAFYAATEAINRFAGAAEKAKPTSDELRQALIDLGRTGQMSRPLLDQFSDGLGDMNEQARKLFDPTQFEGYTQFLSNINRLWGQEGIAGSIKKNFAEYDKALVGLTQSGNADAAKAAFDRIAESMRASGRSLDDVNAAFPLYTQQLYYGGGAAAAYTAQIQRQNQALLTNANRFISSQQQVIDFNQALNAGRDALNRNGTAFWGNSRAALDNQQQILNAANILNRYSDDLIRNNQVTDGNVKRLRGQREQLIDLAERFLGSRKAAEKYVDQLVKIPKTAKTDVSVNAKGKFSMKGLGALGNVPGLADLLGPSLRNAGGGYIGGGGGPRADDKVTRISAGEMVINAPATARYLPLLTAINDEGNAGTIYKGQGYTTASAPSSPAPAPGGGAFAGGGLPTATPTGRARELPAFAGGGLLSSSFTRDYQYRGDPPDTLNKARESNARGLGSMLGYSAGQAAIGAGILTTLLTGGYGKGAKAVAFAKAQLGEPYVWGATGPDSWDCSGLTQAAWRAAGVSIPRVTYDQIAYGTPSSQSRAMPGDLYFPHRGHVMMVTGMGGSRALIHAPRTGDVVRYAGWRSGGTFRHIAGGGGSNYGGGHPKDFARAQLGELGWSAAQFAPLNRLWERESGWRWNARNPSSGAYGIPQALPPGKMASFGSDWRTNWATQIRWGLDYIKRRYGSPARAWAHSQRVGWYADGTDNAQRGWAWVGENGPELVNFRGGEAVYRHEDSLRMAASAAVAPLELSADALAGGGDTHYHAHMDEMTRAAYERQLRTAFTSMQMAQAQRLRIGRRG